MSDTKTNDDVQADEIQELKDNCTDVSEQSDETVPIQKTDFEELKDKYEQLLRAYADADNQRKRAIKDQEDTRKYAGLSIARDMLEVADNITRALSQVTEELRTQANDFIEGIEITQKGIQQMFTRHGIVAVNPEKGDIFDPNIHEAIAQLPASSEEHKSGTILDVAQIGYCIHERLLRPARVVIVQ